MLSCNSGLTKLLLKLGNGHIITSNCLLLIHAGLGNLSVKSQYLTTYFLWWNYPDIKVHEAFIGSTWGRQGPQIPGIYSLSGKASGDASKLRDYILKWPYHSEIWQAPRHQRLEKYIPESRGSETSRWWIEKVNDYRTVNASLRISNSNLIFYHLNSVKNSLVRSLTRICYVGVCKPFNDRTKV